MIHTSTLTGEEEEYMRMDSVDREPCRPKTRQNPLLRLVGSSIHIHMPGQRKECWARLGQALLPLALSPCGRPTCKWRLGVPQLRPETSVYRSLANDGELRGFGSDLHRYGTMRHSAKQYGCYLPICNTTDGASLMWAHVSPAVPRLCSPNRHFNACQPAAQCHRRPPHALREG